MQKYHDEISRMYFRLHNWTKWFTGSIRCFNLIKGSLLSGRVAYTTVTNKNIQVFEKKILSVCRTPKPQRSPFYDEKENTVVACVERNSDASASITNLRRHSLGIGARDFDPSVQACAVVGFNDGPSVTITGPDSTVVAACKWQLHQIKKYSAVITTGWLSKYQRPSL